MHRALILFANRPRQPVSSERLMSDIEGYRIFSVELDFSEDPDRMAARPQHRERLTALHAAGVLVNAGPFTDDTGALLLFRVTDRDALERILASDPYYSGTWILACRVREWAPLFGD
jgi:uncharacterized protein YciI